MSRPKNAASKSKIAAAELTKAQELQAIMGDSYPIAVCEIALERCADNLEIAADWLLTNGERELQRMGRPKKAKALLFPKRKISKREAARVTKEYHQKPRDEAVTNEQEIEIEQGWKEVDEEPSGYYKPQYQIEFLAREEMRTGKQWQQFLFGGEEIQQPGTEEDRFTLQSGKKLNMVEFLELYDRSLRIAKRPTLRTFFPECNPINHRQIEPTGYYAWVDPRQQHRQIQQRKKNDVSESQSENDDTRVASWSAQIQRAIAENGDGVLPPDKIDSLNAFLNAIGSDANKCSAARCAFEYGNRHPVREDPMDQSEWRIKFWKAATRLGSLDAKACLGAAFLEGTATSLNGPRLDVALTCLGSHDPRMKEVETKVASIGDRDGAHYLSFIHQSMFRQTLNVFASRARITSPIDGPRWKSIFTELHRLHRKARLWLQDGSLSFREERDRKRRRWIVYDWAWTSIFLWDRAVPDHVPESKVSSLIKGLFDVLKEAGISGEDWNVPEEDENSPPLWNLLQNNCWPAIESLLSKSDVDLNVLHPLDLRKQTPLIFACERLNVRLAQLLLTAPPHRLDLDQVDVSRKTARMYLNRKTIGSGDEDKEREDRRGLLLSILHDVNDYHSHWYLAVQRHVWSLLQQSFRFPGEIASLVVPYLARIHIHLKPTQSDHTYSKLKTTHQHINRTINRKR